MKVLVLAVGRLRGAYKELCGEYAKRLTYSLSISEIVAPTHKAECEALIKALPVKGFIVLLDERGKDLSSRELADAMTGWLEGPGNNLVFMIGGANGVNDQIRSRANFILGLGRKTWPHQMVRSMLLEQIYRAQQINCGHPYHRD